MEAVKSVAAMVQRNGFLLILFLFTFEAASRSLAISTSPFVSVPRGEVGNPSAIIIL
jgi:hypothetical protein